MTNINFNTISKITNQNKYNIFIPTKEINKIKPEIFKNLSTFAKLFTTIEPSKYIELGLYKIHPYFSQNEYNVYRFRLCGKNVYYRSVENIFNSRNIEIWTGLPGENEWLNEANFFSPYFITCNKRNFTTTEQKEYSIQTNIFNYYHSDVALEADAYNKRWMLFYPITSLVESFNSQRRIKLKEIGDYPTIEQQQAIMKTKRFNSCNKTIIDAAMILSNTIPSLESLKSEITSNYGKRLEKKYITSIKETLKESINIINKIEKDVVEFYEKYPEEKKEE